MNGNSLNTDILQSLSNFYYPYRAFIPTQPCLYCHGYRTAFYYFSGKADHFRDILENSCTGILTDDLFYRTTVIDIQHFRSGFHHDIRGPEHGVEFGTKYLNPYWPFLIVDIEFLYTLVGIAYESFYTNKLSVQHI